MMNKILIVEDEFSISNFMKTVLEGDGYTVEVATCAAQGRAALEKMEFSAMLLDLGLPDADGLELLRELRQRYGLPVIVVSARTEESEKVAALDSGARRLYHQAVRLPGAAGPHPGSAAPGRARRQSFRLYHRRADHRL